MLKITLDETQTAIVGPLLDKHRSEIKTSGLLAAVTRSYRPIEGCVTIELQLLPVTKATLTALRKITRVC